MKYFTTVLILLFATTTAYAKLTPYPEITSVKMVLDNPDVLYIFVSGLEWKVAMSTNAGEEFKVIQESEVPANLTTDLKHENRQYVLTEAKDNLLRTDDNGNSWKETSASRFIRKQVNADIKDHKKWYDDRYGSRVPERSFLWNILFGVFLAINTVLLCLSLRDQGWLKVAVECLQACIILALVWLCLTMLHTFIRHLFITQWPSAYWNSTAGFNPSYKLGLLLNIAAKPIPLLVYLLALWPVLPASPDVLCRWFGKTSSKKHICSLCVIVCGIILISFHVWIFIGPFREH